jgi:hypothetical protein
LSGETRYKGTWETLYCRFAKLVVVALSTATPPSFAQGTTGDPHVYLANAATLEWHARDIPTGASYATQYGGIQMLVRWPAGAVLAPHSRSSIWHGVVLSGTLNIKVGAAEPVALGPLTYFHIRQGTAISAECTRTAPCVYLAFDAKEEQLAVNFAGDAGAGESGLARPPTEAGEVSPVSIVDLKAAQWSPVEGSHGVERVRGEGAGLQARLNTVYPYRLRRGAAAPGPSGQGDAAVFVLFGTQAVRIESGREERLGAGSFYRTRGGLHYTDACVEETCVVLSTEPPAGSRSPRGRVLFPK